MDNNYKYHIDNVFNVFSSLPIDKLLEKYQINNYYQVKQVHSDIVYLIDDHYLNNSLGDAMITNNINYPLVIKTADCIHILIYDNKNKVIGIVHSGWQGTLNNIVGKTIKMMIDKYHIDTNNTSAYIYPSIRECHFEIKEDVFHLFKEKITNINKYVKIKNNKYYLNLQGIVIDNIKELGINNIYDSGICTYCNHDNYYSYRYNNTNKRNYLIAYIKE